jgi:hypothetical protein
MENPKNGKHRFGFFLPGSLKRWYGSDKLFHGDKGDQQSMDDSMVSPYQCLSSCHDPESVATVEFHGGILSLVPFYFRDLLGNREIHI